MSVTVTNGNDEDFVGRFDGHDYEFPVGVPVTIPMVVAEHIFGDSAISRHQKPRSWLDGFVFTGSRVRVDGADDGIKMNGGDPSIDVKKPVDLPHEETAANGKSRIGRAPRVVKGR